MAAFAPGDFEDCAKKPNGGFGFIMKRILSVLAASLFVFAFALPTLALDKPLQLHPLRALPPRAQLRSRARQRRRFPSSITQQTSPISRRTKDGRLSSAVFPMRVSTNEIS